MLVHILSVLGNTLKFHFPVKKWAGGEGAEAPQTQPLRGAWICILVKAWKVQYRICLVRYVRMYQTVKQVLVKLLQFTFVSILYIREDEFDDYFDDMFLWAYCEWRRASLRHEKYAVVEEMSF